jgi:hypothetical protein
MKTRILLVTGKSKSAKVIKKRVRDFFHGPDVKLKISVAKSKSTAKKFVRRHCLQIVVIDKNIFTKTKKLVEWLARRNNGKMPSNQMLIIVMELKQPADKRSKIDILKTSQAICKAVGDIERERVEWRQLAP